MSDRWQRYLTEAGRFFAVGGLATLVSLTIFNILVHGLGGGGPMWSRPVAALVIANLVGMVVSYHGSRSWAFRDRPPRQADGGLTAFVAINLVTMTIPVACLMLSREVLHLDDPASDNVAANVIGLALAFAARFYLFRTYVFLRPEGSGEVSGEPRSTRPSMSGPAAPPAA